MTPPLFLLGATAVGKSAVALELARSRGAAILVLDAMQVYRGATIGVSKPSAAVRAEIPHGGLDLVEIGAAFTVADYLEQATAFLADQERTGRPVIIVGGTGLYFRALTQGLCDAPPTPAALRDELGAFSKAELRARLERVDAPMLERVDVENPRRMLRAIAVMEMTGKSLAAWQAETPPAPVKEFRAVWLQRPKWDLDRCIATRVEEMLAAGWIDEVRELIAHHGAGAVEAFSGIGYRVIAQALDAASGGNATRLLAADPLMSVSAAPVQSMPEVALAPHKLERVRRNILVATRQYAKRQLTWFRREPSLTEVTLSGAAIVPPALLLP